MNQLLGALALAAAFALVAIAISRGKGRNLPLSERGCLSVLQFAAWLERTGTAWDAGIMRYRIEKASTWIEMESTREREGRVTWTVDGKAA